MTSTRRSWRSSALAPVLFACACASAPALETRTGPEPKRKPDGVLLEPSPAIPPAAIRAEASGVVALEPGLSRKELGALVDRLMAGFESEQPERVLELLLVDAVDLVTHGGRDTIAASLRARFAARDYGKIRGLEVAHVDRAEVREYEDLPAAGARARPHEMLPGDLLLRVPMTAPLSNGERLFDDVLLLLLRRDARGQLRIAGIGETS